MDDASGPAPIRDARGRFGPGNPGKPVGARNRMARRVAMSLLRHFTQREDYILQTLSAGHYLGVYARLLAPLLPKDLSDDDPDLEALAPEEAARVAGALRLALDRLQAGEGTLADVQDAFSPVAAGPQASVGYGGNTVEGAQGGQSRSKLPAAPQKPGGLVW